MKDITRTSPIIHMRTPIVKGVGDNGRFSGRKNHSYTVMANHHLRDERLSLKSKGLLSVILSLPDDWRISIEGMTQFSADGKDAIRSAIRELTDAGYITRAQTHSEAGTFSGYEYTIHETPAASPSSGFPTMENPTTGNPTLRNTERLSTNIPPVVPQSDADGGNPSVSLAADTSPVRGGKEGEKGEAGEGGDVSESDTPPKRKRRATKSAPDYRPDTFARFWAAYPRGEDKQGAIARGTSSSPTTRRFRP